MAPSMHMPPTNVPMPSQTKTRHTMHTTSPKPSTSTHNTLYHPRNPMHRIHILSWYSRFPEQALLHKHTKYDPLINTIKNKEWKTNPLITITTDVRGAIHEHSINILTSLQIPKTNIKTLVKSLHQNAIKYLTYLILNKRKLENKQAIVQPP